MKKFLTFFFAFIFVFSIVDVVFAQVPAGSSASWSTRVGEPIGGGNVPPVSGDIRQEIINNFGVTMNGFDETHLRWAWEKFWEMSSGNFMDLIRNSIVLARPAGGYSEQVGCPGGTTVLLGQYNPGDYFKFILTHEFGHVIQNCQPRYKNRSTEHDQAYRSEGPISYYGAHAGEYPCPNSTKLSEDYADTIAYFVNPLVGLASAPCGPQQPPNPYFQLVPRKELHYTNVAVPVLSR